MKKYFLLIFVQSVFLLGIATETYAQETKVGFTNIEIILAYYSPTQQVEKELSQYRKDLEKEIVKMQQLYQEKLSETQKKGNKLNPKEKEDKILEIQDLEQKIQKAIADTEYKLSSKQTVLMQPILNEIQGKINEIAKEDNYTYILNQTSSLNLLYGVETFDITNKLADKLNIELPPLSK